MEIKEHDEWLARLCEEDQARNEGCNDDEECQHRWKRIGENKYGIYYRCMLCGEGGEV